MNSVLFLKKKLSLQIQNIFQRKPHWHDSNVASLDYCSLIVEIYFSKSLFPTGIMCWYMLLFIPFTICPDLLKMICLQKCLVYDKWYHMRIWIDASLSKASKLLDYSKILSAYKFYIALKSENAKPKCFHKHNNTRFPEKYTYRYIFNKYHKIKDKSVSALF